MPPDFQPPPFKWQWLSHIGGIAIAGSLIGVLQLSETQLQHQAHQASQPQAQSLSKLLSKHLISSKIATTTSALGTISTKLLQQRDSISLNSIVEPSIALVNTCEINPVDLIAQQRFNRWEFSVQNPPSHTIADAKGEFLFFPSLCPETNRIKLPQGLKALNTSE
jgi:hypothetical protein